MSVEKTPVNTGTSLISSEFNEKKSLSLRFLVGLVLITNALLFDKTTDKQF